MEKQKKYAMYLRKSRADLELEAMGEGETLKRHEKMLFALAAKHEIHPDQITIYREIVSGESIDDRPEVQKLLSDVYAKKYDGVLVVEIERLARGNTKDQGEVADAFQCSNTHILTVTKIYDPQNEFDQEYFEFGLFMSRREYKTISRRMVAGKNQSAEEGNYLLPQRVFGYDIVKPGKRDRYLVKRESEAEIVQMIFDWFTEDRKTTGWIAKQLTSMGVPTTTNKPEWRKGTIRDMLVNPVFAGYIKWGEYKTVKQHDPVTGKMKKVRIKADESEVKIVNGKHEGIISDEQLEKAVSLMEKKEQPHVNINYDLTNPLAGIMVCAKCGKAMCWFDPTQGRSQRYAHRESALCKVKSLPVTVVWDGLVEALKAFEADFQVKIANDTARDEMAAHQNMIAVMEKELEKMERKRKNLFADYEDGTYTKEEFIERKQHYASSIEALKENIRIANESMPEPVDYEEKIVHIHQVIDCIRNPDISAKEKNVFLKQYIDTIKYDAIDYGRRRGGKPVLDVYLK